MRRKSDSGGAGAATAPAPPGGGREDEPHRDAGAAVLRELEATRPAAARREALDPPLVPDQERALEAVRPRPGDGPALEEGDPEAQVDLAHLPELAARVEGFVLARVVAKEI